MAAGLSYRGTFRIPRRLLAAAGGVVSMWSLLEFEALNIVSQAYRLGRKEGRILFIHQNWSSHLFALTMRCRLKNLDHVRTELEEIAGEVKGAHTIRNSLSHGIWARKVGVGKLRLLKFKGGNNEAYRLLGKPITYTPTDLDAAAAQIKKTIKRLDGWWVKNRRALRSLK